MRPEPRRRHDPRRARAIAASETAAMRIRVFSVAALGALLLAAAWLAVLAPPARADAAAESRDVIERQLDAFAAGDFVGAYAYAAPSIQRMFPTPQIFEQMVTQGYPMVVGPDVVEFLGADERSGQVRHRLRLVDDAGKAFIAQYFLAEVGGAWRITGVMIEEEPDLSV